MPSGEGDRNFAMLRIVVVIPETQPKSLNHRCVHSPASAIPDCQLVHRYARFDMSEHCRSVGVREARRLAYQAAPVCRAGAGA